ALDVNLSSDQIGKLDELTRHRIQYPNWMIKDKAPVGLFQYQNPRGRGRTSGEEKTMDSHETSTKEREVATLGGGCFWCTEAIFDQLKGVEKVESGYSGGKVPDPSYEDVCTGSTGHAESIQITFNPKQISFKDILQIFFTTHDPTTLNRQGADVGTQYR